MPTPNITLADNALTLEVANQFLSKEIHLILPADTESASCIYFLDRLKLDLPFYIRQINLQHMPGTLWSQYSCTLYPVNDNPKNISKQKKNNELDIIFNECLLKANEEYVQLGKVWFFVGKNMPELKAFKVLLERFLELHRKELHFLRQIYLARG